MRTNVSASRRSVRSQPSTWRQRSPAPAGMIGREGRLASVPPRLTHRGDGVRRAISSVVAVLLAVSVVSTVVVWTEGSSEKPLQVVRGAIGAEDGDFFGDP